MKGFSPVVLAVIDRFAGVDFEQPLIVLATADEESSMNGARALAEMGRPKARYAVIGEPTELVPIYMHIGIMMDSVLVRGVSGHSSDPSLCIHAREVMHEVVAELLALRHQWQER